MPADQPKRARAAYAFATLVIAALFAYRVPMLLVRNYDQDEFQHLHSAYCVAGGMVPYLDYYEHHPPGLAWLLAPLVLALGTTWTTVLASRALMLAFSAGILTMTYALGLRVVGHRTATLGVLLLSTTQIFVDKSLEIRPDVPATLLWLVGLTLLLRASANGRMREFAAAGLFCGVGLMFTPKIAFGVLGSVLGTSLVARRRGRLAAHLRGVAALTAALLVPLGATLAVLAIQGAGAQFVNHVLLAPFNWPREVSALRFTRELFVGSPCVAFGGTLGMLLWLAGSACRGRSVSVMPDPEGIDTGVVLAFTGAAIVVGWFIVPVPWPQFLLSVLPLWALAAAGALVWVTDRAEQVLDRQGAMQVVSRWIVPLGVAVAAAWLAWGGLARFVPPRGLYATLLVLLVTAWLSAPSRERLRFGLLLIVVAVPLARISGRINRRDMETRRDFEFLMANTTPSDSVLTGWSTATMFRPHAYHYFFLHPGMLAVLTDEQKGKDVLSLLRERTPRVVVRDRGTRALSAEVNQFIDEHYVASGVGELWLRREP